MFLHLALSVALVSCAAMGLEVDPILWTSPLNDTAELSTPVQWVATSESGVLIALSGDHLVRLNTTSGSVLWRSAPFTGFTISTSIFAVSDTAVMAAAGTVVAAFHLINGSLIGSASIPAGTANPFNSGITSITAQGGLFIVSGMENVAVFDSTLSLRYCAPTVEFYVLSLGASSHYLYFAAAQANATSIFLFIIDLTTFSERRVSDVNYVSSAAANGNILVVQNSRPLVATIALSTGTFVWKNTDVVLNNVTTFVLIASTDVPLVVADNAVYAFDAVTGGLVFQYQTPFPTVSNPVVASGRLVYIGTPAQGPSYVAAMDLSTGKSLGQVMTPSLDSPALAISGGNALMLNGQGYTRVNIIKMLAASYNLDLAGSSAAVVVNQTPLATTFVVIGLKGATAVRIDAV
ncbi:GPI-anchored surface protein, putative [Bodo saltans]|uniref:GPI-anchored surface protein, putative n=1 Tax=Bodo saltans TaxID=75058 RepID=A0A0S4J749_BODSA|nr:GPI-anchored surface protein, putative [Bodo saltans]|eukprot:CUG51978.1 GPI-anchored surface protein, putative [Bodo saltans]